MMRTWTYGMILIGIELLSIGAAGQATNTFPSSGSVGIGTTSPAQKLEVDGSIQAGSLSTGPGGSLVSAGTGGAVGQQAFLYNTTKNSLGVGYLWAIDNMSAVANGNSSGYTNSLQFFVYDSAICGSGAQLCKSRLTLLDTGNVGIGTQIPNALLEVNGGAQIDGTLAGSGGGAVQVGANGITFPNNGGTQTIAYTGINCGGDYAESMDVTGERTNYAPGDVLVLDRDNPGKILKSIEPYSEAVAGIYSTKPGSVGRRQLTPKSDSEIPMAMVGVVPTKVTAENGPIRVGDLLVSSTTPGYAMKGTDRSRMLGAVIGKAMGSLETGAGTIEVLVSLQ